jgi:CRISPR/Cas system-associated exonuclease Cas4 (RecB family)
MPPARFTVTQVRVAAACPRILYFDHEHARRKGLAQPAVTRIWKAGARDEVTACGTLFHLAVEPFTEQAAGDPALRQAVAAARDPEALALELRRRVFQHFVDREALFQKSASQQAAFMAALDRYLTELARIVWHALQSGKPPDEVLAEVFGDRRRKVAVTFLVGPAGEAVHVRGVLDHVFHDWRTARERILDYKLTPARQPAGDLFQVCLYALMHHARYGTRPDVGVLYLHPERRMLEKSWEQIDAERHKVYNLLASMREWVEYDEHRRQGLKPPGDPVYCAACAWRDECVARLGAKHEGERLGHWSEQSAARSQR